MSAKHEERSYLECLFVKMINAYKISIFGDSVMAYDKLIEMTKSTPTRTSLTKTIPTKPIQKALTKKG